MDTRSRSRRANLTPAFFTPFKSSFSNLDRFSNTSATYAPSIDALSLALPPDILPAPGPSIAKYMEQDLQHILKIVINARAPVPASAPAPERPRKRSLKARFFDVYYGKSHIDCYYFC